VLDPEVPPSFELELALSAHATATVRLMKSGKARHPVMRAEA